MMNLIGFDIGFSATRATSGIAKVEDDSLSCKRTTSDWSRREKVLGSCVAEVIAIDGPVLENIGYPQRLCETVFARGLFARRCKPAFSHVAGTGQKFRVATHETAMRLANLTHGRHTECAFPRVIKGKNIVEAFPNAFLGVLLADSCFKEMGRLKRGKKFDWLYEQCREGGAFRSLVDSVGAGNVSAAKIEENEDHEERAALVCLLTAAAVAVGHYTAIGEERGGYFFLPPLALWAEWARREIELQRERDHTVEVWVNGKRYRAGEQLP
jgi:hypothetical protein